jgi:hypothetical protein
MNEYLRPWKLTTFAAGIGLLIAGALHYKQYDWDSGISLIMGTLAYLTAPWALGIVRSLRWRLLPLALFAYWITVDGSYTAYNSWSGHPVDGELRKANLVASTLLYLLSGYVWFPQKNFKEVLLSLADAFNGRRPKSEIVGNSKALKWGRVREAGRKKMESQGNKDKSGGSCT